MCLYLDILASVDLRQNKVQYQINMIVVPKFSFLIKLSNLAAILLCKSKSNKIYIFPVSVRFISSKNCSFDLCQHFHKIMT